MSPTADELRARILDAMCRYEDKMRPKAPKSKSPYQARTGTLLPPLERREQVALATWLDATIGPVGWTHVANEGGKGRNGEALQRQGLKPGVPDNLIFVRPRHGQCHGVAIELKRQQPDRWLSAFEGGQVIEAPIPVRPITYAKVYSRDGGISRTQREWLSFYASIHWHAVVAYGADAAVNYLKELGYGSNQTDR